MHVHSDFLIRCDSTVQNASALLRAWRCGDIHAGRDLVVRHERAVARFFCTHVDAEESLGLVQQVFCALRDDADRCEDVRVALYHRAYRRLCAHLRMKAEPRSDAAETTDGVRGATTRLRGGLSDRRPTLAALQRLPLPQRVALELKYWERLTLAELSVVFETSPPATECLLAAARTALQAELRPALRDERAVTRIH